MENRRAAPADVIRLAIASGRTPYEAYAEFEAAFQRTLGCELDYARRLLGGTRVLTVAHERRIGDLLVLPELNLYSGAREAAKQLGLSRSETNRLLPDAFAGFDFGCRTSDRQQVHQLEALIGGFWECFYWSVSKVGEQAINRELLIVDGVDSAAFINCRIVDLYFTNSGVAFPVLSHLYFFFEKDRLLDEISVHLTNRPDRFPPGLRGLMLCLSGGVDEIHSYPSAGKTSYRYLGRTTDQVRRIYPSAPNGTAALEKWLSETVPRYILKDEMTTLDAATREHIARVDNSIGPDATPFALRAM